MANRVHVPSQGPADWQRLLARPHHWKDGHSAKTAAECWESSHGLPSSIGDQFRFAGFDSAELLLAIPEWRTPLDGGARETQTDIFALIKISRGVFACSVEAKVTEPFGPTIGEWLDYASDGKRQRFKYLREILGLEGPLPPTLRYQLFHRAAAAVIEAERFGCAGAGLIIHSFSEERFWLEDFQAFASALGATVSPFEPAMVTLPGNVPLLLAWASDIWTRVATGPKQ